MTEAAIPLVPNQESGSEELAGGSPVAVNVVIDARGAVSRRPGILAHSSLPSTVVDAAGISGVYVTSQGKRFLTADGAVNRSIYFLNGATAVSISDSPSERLDGTRRPVFASTEALLVIAAGASMQKVVIDGLDSSRLMGTPPLASHVAAISSRLLANSVATGELGRVHYSGPAAGTSYAGHETWEISDDDTAGFFAAEARPDPVVAIHENTNELFVFGSTNVQVFSPDPTFVFSPAATREYGCIAPYSIVKVDGQFYWLDHLRRVVRFDGRNFQIISQAIQRTLDEIDDVTQAFGYRVHHGVVDAVVWTFPEDGRSFCYSPPSGGWSQWMGTSSTGQLGRLAINAQAIDPTTGLNIVGTTSGRVGVISSSASTDLGTEIRATVTSGRVTRNTSNLKACKAVRLAFRRGTNTGTAPPVALLSWRDDEGAWNGPLGLGLGVSGDTDPVIQLRGFGTYRGRQWRLEFTGDEDFVLVSATEEFEVLSA